MWSLALRTLVRAPGRLALTLLAVAFPVAVLGSTMLYIDHEVQGMTAQSLSPVQVDMRALATSLDVDMRGVREALARVPDVQSADLFGAADVIVGARGAPTRLTARMIAVEPAYFDHQPWAVANGDVSQGALLNGGITATPEFAHARSVSIELRGAEQPLGLTVPVAGTVDARTAANTWFAIPAGDVQGDVVVTPRVIVVDYNWFIENVLPALQHQYGGPAAVTNPGLSELPPASLETHVSIDPAAFPADPAAASAWSSAFRRVLERRAPGDILVSDNAVEPLTEAAGDATGAKLIFFLIAIPGSLVAAALGLAAASALAESQRHEDDILRTRGAGEGQLAALTLRQSLVVVPGGIGLGLAAATVVVTAMVGAAAWSGLSTRQVVLIAVLSVLVGSVHLTARLLALLRTRRRSSRAPRPPGATSYHPGWRRFRLDLALVVIGLAILALNVAFGGIRLPLLDTDHQNQTLALAFFVLLAPLALWVGGALLAVRGWLVLLARRTAPDRARPLSTWTRTVVRWLGRRPSRAAVTLTLGVLAVAFASMVMTFTATYDAAKSDDAHAAFGSDLRLEPATDVPTPLPDLGSAVNSTTPVLYVPARAGSDRKTIAAIDPATYAATVTRQPVMLSGHGVDALMADPRVVVVSEEIQRDFDLRIGDTMPVTVFPDDLDLTSKLDLRVVGVFRSFPPDDPFSEMVMSIHALVPPVPSPDLYLARTGGDPTAAAEQLRSGGVEQTYTVLTIADMARQHQRSLAALSLGGLGQIETVVGALVSGVAVGLLGAFTILERRRELAVLRMVGATSRQLRRPPAVEGTVASLGSLVTGIPIGILLALVAVRVLGLFFTLPPPVVVVPAGPLLILTALVLLTSATAIGVVMHQVGRMKLAPLLREP